MAAPISMLWYNPLFCCPLQPPNLSSKLTQSCSCSRERQLKNNLTIHLLSEPPFIGTYFSLKCLRYETKKAESVITCFCKKKRMLFATTEPLLNMVVLASTHRTVTNKFVRSNFLPTCAKPGTMLIETFLSGDLYRYDSDG